MARTRWPPGPVNPGLLPRPGRSDRQRRWVPKTGARPTDRYPDSPRRRRPIRRSGRDPVPDPTPTPRQTRGSRAGAPIHILPAEYALLHRAPSGANAGCRLSVLSHHGLPVFAHAPRRARGGVQGAGARSAFAGSRPGSVRCAGVSSRSRAVPDRVLVAGDLCQPAQTGPQRGPV